ncbi:MFS transporter [Burkholderia ubonensis]|uniref:MFS transporter n=1 Tax=Burkholderia ubonensis TaxID=101571 RepID=UPI0007567BCA|nr:MFS transporter [Burkholderia ubonensis]KVM12257.1 MFS transporter [Burkholderia ubonensis]KVM15343.1 MFS transporter [Burkholderia ubonensis]KVM42947.1 MFS transporter [Burkholderia ubonensis]KVP79474.1 MFS transporter [Burkholderia ubonensis]KVU10229.1 MFS transporter [Burkholderia ubonensis]
MTTHTITLVGYLAASSVPTPLYRLYQAQWHFSPMLLTLIFGVYALSLLSALIVAGALSDYIGRRPVISAALVLEMGAMGLFLAAAGPGWLIAARVLQGVATGLATASVAAALIDLDRERGAFTNGLAPMGGMSLGVLGSTALAQLAPAPLHLAFVLLLALFAFQLLQTWRTPETAGGRPGALMSLRPSISVPPAARAELLAITPINIAVWALGGFYLSLMPSLIGKVTGAASVWFGGLSVAALTLSGGAAVLVVRVRKPLPVLIVGALALLIGIPAILAGADLGVTAILLVGSVIAGIGFGAGFLGAVRSVMPLAQPHERAGLMAAFYVESYLANCLPAILAGYMTPRLGLLKVANFYGGALMLLVLAGLVLAIVRHRSDRRVAGQAAH